jgi:tetratricopeptide (TPR) repeat protein
MGRIIFAVVLIVCMECAGYRQDTHRGTEEPNPAAGQEPNNIEKNYRKAAKPDPELDYYMRLWMFYFSRGRYEDALDTAEQAIGLYPGKDELFIIRGRSLTGLRNWEAAETDFNEAIRMNPLNEVYST